MTRAAGAAAAVLLAVGIVALREATISRDTPVPAGAVTTVVFDVDAGLVHMPPGVTVAGVAESLLDVCLLEVHGGTLGPEHMRDDRFRATIRPGLDTSDRTQLRGCLEDWTVDHVLVDVVRLETEAP